MYKNDLVKENKFMQWYRYYFAPLSPKKYYETTYTNINQFNFEFSPRIKKLNFHKLRADLSLLHKYSTVDLMEDKDLIIEAEKLGLYNCLIVIDEASHYFVKPVDKVLVWWLTYHAHLYQDIHIITQHMDNVPNEYLLNGEFFYMVYPPSKAIFKNKFSLGLYSCIKFYKNCKVSDLTIPFLPEVAQLYVAGKPAERKLVLKKFIPIFFFLFLVFAWSIYNFFSTNDEIINSFKDENTTIDSNISTSYTPQNSPKNRLSKDNIETPGVTDFVDKTLVTFQCIHDTCKTKQHKNIPMSFILFLYEKQDKSYADIKKITYQYTIYNLMLSEDSIKLLDRSFVSNSSRGNSDNSVPSQTPPKLF
ncbi:MAG: zonular occludens toxin domain-containing protein [Sulfurimonas sp.]